MIIIPGLYIQPTKDTIYKCTIMSMSREELENMADDFDEREFMDEIFRESEIERLDEILRDQEMEARIDADMRMDADVHRAEAGYLGGDH